MEVELIAGRKRRKGGFFKRLSQGVAKVAKKGWKAIKKTNPVLVFARSSFLLLVKMNLKGLATRLNLADKAKLKQKWEKVGGKFSALEKAIKSARKLKVKKVAKGSTINGRGCYGVYDGAADISLGPALPAAIAAATAILEFIKPLLKPRSEGGLLPDGVINPSTAEFLDGAGSVDDLINEGKGSDSDLFKLTAHSVADVGPDIEGQASNSGALPDSGFDVSKMMLPLLALGGGALLLFSRKK
jgi:hypothetical protein